MDSSNLLCDEVWLSNSTPLNYYNNPPRSSNDGCAGSFYSSKQDCKLAFSICLQKEETYMPKQGFFKYLHSERLIFARLRAIRWLIKSCSRFNLSFETLFNAANYLDRFLCMKHCHGWKNWMVELLSVACLSIASKFSETSPPSLPEIQMEDLDHTFESITIQKMELMVLNTLGWRVSSTTAYSYVELLITMKTDDFFVSHLQKHSLVARVTQLLLAVILDCKMVEYRPSIAAISAIWCGLEELIPTKSETHLAYITGLLDQNLKDDIVKCRNMMQAKLIDPLDNCPSSPVTVLLTGRISVYDEHVDLSLFEAQESDTDILESNKKRRKERKQI